METSTPAPAPASAITTTARCFCRAFDLPLIFPVANLPIPVYLCLCNSCRLVTGSLSFADINLPQSVASAINPSTYNLTPYQTSASITRYYCSTCGAHCLLHNSNGNKYSVATALLDRTKGIVEWKGTKHIGRVGEASGLRSWLRGDGFKHFVDGEGSTIHTENISLNTSKHTAESPSNILPASCHCKSVSFYISRPDASSTQLSAPYPDLIHPYYSTDPDILSNPQSETWWLRPDRDPSSPTKYLSGLCTCPTCILTSGTHFQPWAFIPLSNIFVPSSSFSPYPPSSTSPPILPPSDPAPKNEPLHLTPTTSNLPSLRIFTSTHPSTHRAFCARCGATVFWFSSGGRGGLVDVSVGVLGSGEDDERKGESLDNWLEWWTQRISFSELAEEGQTGSGVLLRAVEKGLRVWGEERTKEGG